MTIPNSVLILLAGDIIKWGRTADIFWTYPLPPPSPPLHPANLFIMPPGLDRGIRGVGGGGREMIAAPFLHRQKRKMKYYEE